MTEPSELAKTDDRLAEILGEYMDALRKGEAPSKSKILNQHPDLAEDLSTCLASLAFVQMAGVKATDTGGTAEFDGPTVIGDFKLIREIGRGGMGVVYEAAQTSLDRRVALKVLPLAGMLDERQKARFQNEARAVGLLVHENIVPIYQVGADRGIHFYAMQFIDGRTLADLISDLREAPSERLEPQAPNKTAQGSTARIHSQSEDTTFGRSGDSPISKILFASASGHELHRSPQFFRMVAKIGIQAASALQHAHESGVVHRDIKPTNLLIDVNAKVWVADFGLALIESDAGLTCTGDVLGTARYMSPEQATGDKLIDYRTDVFSLGMTLYELATLKHASPGDDRLKIIQQICNDEPQPLRLHNDRIPAELETIILKCLEKNPAERYASASELATDLQRFLDDRPILAKRPTLAHRANKWTRRNWAVFMTVVVSTVLLLIAVTTVSLVAMSRLSASERLSLERLYESLLQRAAAKRETLDADRRPESLKSTKEAAQLMKQLEIDDDPEQVLRVRNAMISSLTIPVEIDLIVDRKHDDLSMTTVFDAKFSCYTRHEGDDLVVRNVKDDSELTRLPQHEANSELFDLSIDGRYLTYAALDPKSPSGYAFRVWDGVEGRRIVDVPATMLVHSVSGSFSEQNCQVWFPTGDDTLTAFALPSGVEIHKVNVADSIICFSVSPKGDKLAVSTGYGIDIYDFNGPTEKRTRLPVKSSILKIEWSRSGRYLAAADAMRRGYAWDTHSNELTTILSGGNVKDIGFNASETMLGTRHRSGHTTIWDILTGSSLLSIPGRFCQFHGKENQVATNTHDQTRLWEIKTPTEFRTYQALGTNEVTSALTIDNQLVIGGCQHGLRFWSKDSGRLLAEVPSLIRANVLHHERSASLVTNSRSGVQIWPMIKNQDQISIGPPTLLAANPNAHFAEMSKSRDESVVATLIDAVAGSPMHLSLYDIGKQEHICNLPVHNRTRFVSLNRDGTLVATGAWHSGGLWIWQVSKRMAIRQLHQGDGHVSGRFSPDGMSIVVATGSSYVTYDTVTWTERWRIEFDKVKESPHLMVFTPDSDVVAIRTDDRSIRLVKVANGQEVASLEDTDRIPGLTGSLSADGRCIIEPVFNVVKIWDIAGIRNRLAEVDLDWNGPPLPAVSDDSSAQIESVHVVNN